MTSGDLMHNFDILLGDLEILREDLQNDRDSGEIVSYGDYINEFNRILIGLKKEKSDIIMDIGLIKKVPRNSKSISGGYSAAEYAKQMEVLRNTKKILSRLQSTEAEENNSLKILENLFLKFNAVTTQLTKRHNNEETLVIKNEYDVQDLLHSLLKLFFDDIRPEEYTPSYGGGSKRMDFLLKREKIVIETKITGDKHQDKEITKELIEDIATYKTHPDCKVLACFIYDPGFYIKNPIGLEDDLEQQSTDELQVLIFIYPK